MKKVLCFLVVFLFPATSTAQDRIEDGAFHVGVNLGELPWGGSFKPGIMIGYHVNDLVYVGATYQFKDAIKRNGTSFNAQGLGRKGIVSSKESVASRFLLHARLRPHRYAPFVSLGLVVNGRDTETTRFLDGLEVTQSRPAGVRPSVGLGYSYTFDFGLELSTEWSGWVLERPNPEISFGGTPIGESERAAIAKSGTKSFQRQITNKYHIFLMSAGYTFR